MRGVCLRVRRGRSLTGLLFTEEDWHGLSATNEAGYFVHLPARSGAWTADWARRKWMSLAPPRKPRHMLFESTTLHRRVPYAVLRGFSFLDASAGNDGNGSTPERRSQCPPADEDVHLERRSCREAGAVREDLHRPGSSGSRRFISRVPRRGTDLIGMVADRSPDFYEVLDGELVKSV